MSISSVSQERYRYFIELRPTVDETAPRATAQAERRRQALTFVKDLHAWLDKNSLAPKVQTLDVTVFGQIHITCESDLIEKVRDDETLNIASIRQAPGFHGGLRKLLQSNQPPTQRTA